MDEQKDMLGELLRQAREAKKLSVQQVSQRLRLSEAKIVAMESDDATLMQTDLARGYLRNYARLLQIDEQALLDAHSRIFARPKQQIHIATEVLQKSADKNNAIKKFMLLGIFSVLVVFAIGFAGYQLFNQQKITQNNSVVDATAIDDNEKQVLDKEQVAAEVKQQAEKQDIASASGSSNGPMQQGQIEIKFVFSEQSWTSVRDGEGHSIYNKLAEADTQDVVYGFPPLKIIIGNVHGTKLYAHGGEVSL